MGGRGGLWCVCERERVCVCVCLRAHNNKYCIFLTEMVYHMYIYLHLSVISNCLCARQGWSVIGLLLACDMTHPYA